MIAQLLPQLIKIYDQLQLARLIRRLGDAAWKKIADLRDVLIR
jgi:hypothetical protein